MTKLPFRIRQDTDMERYRADTFWTKEPETIAWIDSFKPGDTFLDIGANIGIYSLYAGSRGVNAWAVEPHPGNFHALTINTRMLNRALPVKVIKACVGDTVATVGFRCETKEAGTTGGGYTLTRGQSGPVSCYTVDELKDVIYADEMSRGDIGKGGLAEFEAKMKYAEDIATEVSAGEGEAGVKKRIKEKIDGYKVMQWTGLQPGQEMGTILTSITRSCNFLTTLLRRFTPSFSEVDSKLSARSSR